MQYRIQFTVPDSAEERRGMSEGNYIAEALHKLWAAIATSGVLTQVVQRPFLREGEDLRIGLAQYVSYGATGWGDSAPRADGDDPRGGEPC